MRKHKIKKAQKVKDKISCSIWGKIQYMEKQA